MSPQPTTRLGLRSWGAGEEELAAEGRACPPKSAHGAGTPSFSSPVMGLTESWGAPKDGSRLMKANSTTPLGRDPVAAEQWGAHRWASGRRPQPPAPQSALYSLPIAPVGWLMTCLVFIICVSARGWGIGGALLGPRRLPSTQDDGSSPEGSPQTFSGCCWWWHHGARKRLKSERRSLRSEFWDVRTGFEGACGRSTPLDVPVLPARGTRAPTRSREKAPQRRRRGACCSQALFACQSGNVPP